jgi:PTS system fructose-specific IIA component/PTS system nitrogen regulatory IIA component
LLWFTDAPEPPQIYAFQKFLFSDRSIRTKEQAIAAILDRLVEVGSLEAAHRQGLFAAILKREELGSTAIGNGVAIPHAKHSSVGSTLGAIANFPSGVDFESLDGHPVRLVCLLVSSIDRPGEHLRLLETVSRKLAKGSLGPVT